jgi:phosphatidate cytidylyltransferase
MRSPNIDAANGGLAGWWREPGHDKVKESEQARDSASDEIFRRVVSGLVLAVVAVATAITGGALFMLLWLGAAIGVFWEWTGIIAPDALTLRLFAGAALVLAGAALYAGGIGAAVAAVAAGVIAAALLGPRQRRIWGAAGMVYSATLLLAPVLLRRDPQFGRTAILFLFAVVWATDICAYFVGRRIGGPKLAARISPRKTWSGACGGIMGAVAAGLVVIHLTGDIAVLPMGLIAVALSIAAQGGDLLESAVKRRFCVKDASQIIPGHGGLMDRLDGFLAAVGVAALVGLARGGFEAPGRGLLLW